MPRFLEPGIKVRNPASPAALRVQDGAAARKKEPLAAIRSAGSAAGFPAKRAGTIGRVVQMSVVAALWRFPYRFSSHGAQDAVCEEEAQASEVARCVHAS